MPRCTVPGARSFDPDRVISMAALLTLESIGPRGEELAMQAGEATDIPVGWDSEFECATFDAESLEEAQLQETVFAALAGLDPDWQTHLRVAD
jgi:hypothetical protein